MLAKVSRALSRHMANRRLPLDGYPSIDVPTPYLDLLSDDEVQRLNQLVDWNAFTVDGRGRRFGAIAWKGKRVEPQAIPDPRIVELDRRFQLSGKRVLEFGSFEGIHTVALCRLAGRVKAIDSRVDNVVKTVIRCAFFGQTPSVFKYDVEDVPADVELLEADIAHHVGVLYHLRDPVSHLLDLGRYVHGAIMLDTHYALEEDATEEYESCGHSVRFKRYREFGLSDAFSGMYDHAKWLTRPDIIGFLGKAGFDRVDVAEDRLERNGPRVLIFAQRTA